MEKTISNFKKEIATSTPEELIRVLKDTNIEPDAVIKAIKKEKTASKKIYTSDERLQFTLSNNVNNTKISKRIFHDVELDMDTSYIRDIVNAYYMWQDNRIKVSNQAQALLRTTGNHNSIMEYFVSQLETIENNMETYLSVWTDRHPVGIWLKAQKGIGPVIAAGILSNFDVTKTRTAGGFWKYIGWAEGGENRVMRKKGEKIQYSPKARVLVWKAAQSFKMQANRDNCQYGELYNMIKSKYVEKNENGGFKNNASYELSIKKYDVNTDAYKAYASGKLPAKHIDAMAMRYTGKIFLSHVFDVMYMYEYGELPPVPYAIAHLDHVHMYVPRHLDVLIPHLCEKHPDVDWAYELTHNYFKGMCEL